METISLKLKLLKPTDAKKNMYQQMTDLNMSFSNRLLYYDGLVKTTSKVYKLFSNEKLPSAVVNQTIREVKLKKKNQKAKRFRRFCWYSTPKI